MIVDPFLTLTFLNQQSVYGQLTSLLFSKARTAEPDSQRIICLLCARLATCLYSKLTLAGVVI